ncbi:MAG: hypothetical protein HYW78_03825, partial [Parcubacteria group bacterium]|nr:hypothetical protein [Parcubacteria group bacterium]
MKRYFHRTDFYNNHRSVTTVLLLSAIFFVAAFVFTYENAHAAWTGPTAAPPGDNLPPPVMSSYGSTNFNKFDSNTGQEAGLFIGGPAKIIGRGKCMFSSSTTTYATTTGCATNFSQGIELGDPTGNYWSGVGDRPFLRIGVPNSQWLPIMTIYRGGWDSMSEIFKIRSDGGVVIMPKGGTGGWGGGSNEADTSMAFSIRNEPWGVSSSTNIFQIERGMGRVTINAPSSAGMVNGMLIVPRGTFSFGTTTWFAYNRIGSGGTPSVAASANDLYVQGTVEATTLKGILSGGSLVAASDVIAGSFANGPYQFPNKLAIGMSSNATNTLDVEGAAAIGATYSGTSAAPANGLIVEGSVGIGTTAPNAPLHVNSSLAALSPTLNLYRNVTFPGDTGGGTLSGIYNVLNQNDTAHMGGSVFGIYNSALTNTVGWNGNAYGIYSKIEGSITVDNGANSLTAIYGDTVVGAN